MVANWIMVVAGIFNILSPWVLGFSSISTAKWSSMVIGLLVLLLNLWILFGDVETEVGDAEVKNPKP